MPFFDWLSFVNSFTLIQLHLRRDSKKVAGHAFRTNCPNHSSDRIQASRAAGSQREPVSFEWFIVSVFGIVKVTDFALTGKIQGHLGGRMSRAYSTREV